MQGVKSNYTGGYTKPTEVYSSMHNDIMLIIILYTTKNIFQTIIFLIAVSTVPALALLGPYFRVPAPVEWHFAAVVRAQSVLVCHSLRDSLVLCLLTLVYDTCGGLSGRAFVLLNTQYQTINNNN